MASPDQDLVDGMAFLGGDGNGDIRAELVVHHFTVAIVAIDGDEDPAAGIGDARSTGPPLKPPNTTEWMTPKRAHASMVMGNSASMGM